MMLLIIKSKCKCFKCLGLIERFAAKAYPAIHWKSPSPQRASTGNMAEP